MTVVTRKWTEYCGICTSRHQMSKMSRGLCKNPPTPNRRLQELMHWKNTPFRFDQEYICECDLCDNKICFFVKILPWFHVSKCPKLFENPNSLSDQPSPAEIAVSLSSQSSHWSSWVLGKVGEPSQLSRGTLTAQHNEENQENAGLRILVQNHHFWRSELFFFMFQPVHEKQPKTWKRQPKTNSPRITSKLKASHTWSTRLWAAPLNALGGSTSSP